MNKQMSVVRSQLAGRRMVITGVRPDRTRSRLRSGFTLIEILIVIGIIVILAGIVLAVGATLAASQNIKRTEATMQILESALNEWEALMRRDLTWGIDGQPPPPPGSVYEPRYDMQEDTMHVFLVSDLLDNVGRSPDIRSILAQIDQQRYIQYEDYSSAQPPAWIREGQLASVQATEPDPQAASWVADAANWNDKHTALDAWERPIRVVHPGRKWTAGDVLPGPDEDGTVHTPLEDVYGTASNAKPYFVSGGPDGRFGDISALEGTPMHDATLDNIYSYEVEKP